MENSRDMVERNIKQIPVLLLVARSYAFILVGLRPLLVAVWPWIGVVYTARQAAGFSGAFASDGEVSTGLWILIVANLVAGSAISVLCHRVIILGEWPVGLRSIHFGRREAYYLLAMLGVGFAATLIMVLFTGLIRIASLENSGGSVSTIVILLASLVLYARVSMIFPDLAVVEDRFPWHVWEISYGHTARIILGMVLSGLPLAIIIQQLVTVAVTLETRGIIGVAMIVDFFALVVTFLAIMSSTAFMSFVYKFLVLDKFLPPTPFGS